jgi:putative hydrolase of the HAD superfamily
MTATGFHRAPVVVAFDLDDTLYPERSYALSGFRAASRWAETELAVPDLVPEMTRLLDAGHLGRLFGMALAQVRPDHSAADLAGLLKTYQSHAPQITLFADGAAALERYRSLAPLALITDGTQGMQRAKVAALGIAGHFREIVYTDALGPDRAFFKPHPRSFEQVAARLPADRYVYIGDNAAKDFVAPNALGWTTVQVVRTGTIHPSDRISPGGAPMHRVASLAELPDVLGF